MPVVAGEIRFGEARAFERRASFIARQDHASAERREPRIDKGQPFPERPRRAGLLGQAQRLASAFAEHRRHRKIRPLVERDLGAQPVHRQPPLQIGEPRRLRIEPDRLARLDHDEIVQVFALRGQQRGVDRAVGRDLLDVVRDEPLQENPAIRARHGEDAAAVEQDKIALRHHSIVVCRCRAALQD